MGHQGEPLPYLAPKVAQPEGKALLRLHGVQLRVVALQSPRAIEPTCLFSRQRRLSVLLKLQ